MAKKRRARISNSNVKRRKGGDTYPSKKKLTCDHKKECNENFSYYISGEGKIFYLEGDTLGTTNMLLETRYYKPEDLIVANYEKTTFEKIRRDGRVTVFHETAREYLSHTEEKFVGIYLDYCDTPTKHYRDISLCFERNLFSENCRVPFCLTFSRRDKDWEDRRYATIATIEKLAKDHGYKCEESHVKDPYERMYFLLFYISVDDKAKNEQYPVLDITDKRETTDGFEYLTRWNVDNLESTWEPENEVRHLDAFEEFEEKERLLERAKCCKTCSRK